MKGKVLKKNLEKIYELEMIKSKLNNQLKRYHTKLNNSLLHKEIINREKTTKKAIKNSKIIPQETIVQPANKIEMENDLLKRKKQEEEEKEIKQEKIQENMQKRTKHTSNDALERFLNKFQVDNVHLKCEKSDNFFKIENRERNLNKKET